MSIEQKYIDLFTKVSIKAAFSTYRYIGKKDKVGADKAAVDSMREELNKIEMNGTVVIGEGELDEAPMLYIGEELGTKKGPYFDIAVDPVEGTNFVANNLPGALSVIAISEKSNLFNAPETYMDKICADVKEKKVIDLDYDIKKNIHNLADYKNKKPEEINVCILDRPRHKEIIDNLIKLKVNIKLISDGDVAGALMVTEKKHNIDLFLGIGGGPEGVLAASALDTFKCFFQGKFIFQSDIDKLRAKKMGIRHLDKKYELNEIIKGDTIFCATGITTGDLVDGIYLDKEYFVSETLVTHKSSGYIKKIKDKQKI